MNILRTTFLTTFIVLSFVHLACNQGSKGNDYTQNEDENITIKGVVENPQNQEVTLERIENDQLIGIDTFIMGDDNAFVFQLRVEEPDYYMLNIGGVQKRILILNKSNVTIKAGGLWYERYI